MRLREVVWGGLAAALSLVATLGAGVVLVPDVSLYVGSGVGLYPSPLGTLVGSLAGVEGLAALHAAATAGLVVLALRARPSLRAVAVSVPVLWWVVPLGVDVIAALLLVAGLVYGRRWASWLAAGFHLAALPLAIAAAAAGARRRLAALGLALGALGLALTPYGAAVPGGMGSLLQALPAAAVVLALGLAPVGLGARLPLPALAGTAAVVLYATAAHVESGEPFGLSVFAASRYALPLAVCVLVAQRSDGRTERPTTAPGKVGAMRAKTFALTVAVAALGALILASSALAVTVPAVPVSDYGSSLLSSLATAIGQIFPYAAAITAFAIGVGMVKRWLGHRKATRV
jgi:hypothetical protein